MESNSLLSCHLLIGEIAVSELGMTETGSVSVIGGPFCKGKKAEGGDRAVFKNAGKVKVPSVAKKTQNSAHRALNSPPPPPATENTQSGQLSSFFLSPEVTRKGSKFRFN